MISFSKPPGSKANLISPLRRDFSITGIEEDDGPYNFDYVLLLDGGVKLFVSKTDSEIRIGKLHYNFHTKYSE